MTPHARFSAVLDRVACATSIARTRADDARRVELHAGGPRDVAARIEAAAERLERVAERLEGNVSRPAVRVPLSADDRSALKGEIDRRRRATVGKADAA